MEKIKKRKLNIIIFPIIALLCISLSFTGKEKSLAIDRSIFINEIFIPYPQEISDSDVEVFPWIELYNNSNEDIDITNWSLRFNYRYLGETSVLKIVMPTYIFSSNSFALIGENEEVSTNISLTLEDVFRIDLADSLESIELLDGQNKTIDKVKINQKELELLVYNQDLNLQFVKDHSYFSFARATSLTDIDHTVDESILLQITDIPSPGKENIFRPKIQIITTKNLYVNEDIFLKAENANNHTLEGDIVEYNWQIANNQDEIILESEQENLNINISDTGIYKVNLMIHDINSLTDFDEIYLNITQSPDDIVLTEIEEAKLLPDNTTVNIKGTLSAPFKSIYEKESYIQKGEYGLRVRLNIPELQPLENETYIFSGKMGTVYGERRLTIEDIISLEDTIPIETKNLQIEEISEEHIGLLINTSGTINRIRDRFVYIINNNETEFPFYISSFSNIDLFTSNTKGKDLKITGIISRYGTDAQGNARIRLMPRYSSDIYVIETLDTTQNSSLATTGQSILHNIFLGIALIIVFTKLFIRKIAF